MACFKFACAAAGDNLEAAESVTAERREIADEFARPHVQASVDMALGGKIEDGVKTVFAEQAADIPRGGNIAVYENMPWVLLKVRQVLKIPGIGKLVEIDDAPIGLADKEPDKRRPDKTGAAGDQVFHD